MEDAGAQDALEVALLAREAERRQALIDDDLTALGNLVTDDLVHVHATGNVHGKAELIAHAGRFLEFLDVGRGPLTIRRLCDDAAVMTGPMTNTVRRRGEDERVVVNAFVTQVWVRRELGWQIASFHAVRLPEKV